MALTTLDAASPRTRRWLTAAAAVLGLAALAPGEAPHVAQTSGAVEIGTGTPPTWKVARPGEPLAPGSAVRTGPGASAELELGTRTIRLYENSVLRLPEGGDAMGPHGPRAVDLERGRSLFDVLRGDEGDRFDVRTREVVVSVKGTRFLVDASAADLASVAVFRGRVGVRELSDTLAHEVTVRPGFSAFGGAGRAFELRLTPFDDPWDGWSSGPPPVPRAAAPTPSTGMPPAKAAALEARSAARRAAGAEVMALELGAERAKRAAEGPAAARPGEGRPVAFPASRDPGADPMARQRPGGDLDPLADIARRKRDLRPDGMAGVVLEGAFAGDSVDAGAAMPGGANAFLSGIPFTYEIDGSKLLVFGPGGLYTTLNETQIDAFLANSAAGQIDPMMLGTPVMQLLMSYGIDPRDLEAFMENVDGQF